MSRPRIAVTGVTRDRNGTAITGVNAAYVRCVLAAGAIPVVITPEFDPECALELFGECDGLLLTGGEDVDPARYGAVPHERLGDVSAERDVNELALIAEARARDLPILGICRGIQIINVACGGTLHQDLPSTRPSEVVHDPKGERNARTHAITVTGGSRLATMLGIERFEANSFHHQAIDALGAGLVASAVAPDGVIEGIESSDPQEWIVAVQWHPEELALDAEAPDLHLFAAFVAASRRAS